MKQKTLIILDWDDTLFPTSWLVKMNINLNDQIVKKYYQKYFEKLDNLIHKLLSILMRYGRVIIVTNALLTWISVSSSVLPRTQKLANYIKIVSARGEYQQYTPNILEWKTLAFKNEFNKTHKYDKTSKYDNKIYNIISIGDAEYEYMALVNLYGFNKEHKKILKSIKLVKNPSLEVLYDELNVLIHSMPYIIKSKKHMDMNFNFYQ